VLKTIAEPSPELLQFIQALHLPLSTPQLRHVTRIADGLITTQGSKTLSALYRHIVVLFGNIITHWCSFQIVSSG
jgi:hypothetical protein